MVRLVDDDHVEGRRALAQLIEEDLARGERHRNDQSGLLSEDVHRRRLLPPLEEVGTVREDVEVEAELRPELRLPALGFGCSPRHDEDSACLVALSEPAEDEPSFRRLAEAGVVGDQQPGPHRARDTHERHELVGLDSDRTPIKADELFTTASHRREQRLVQRSPAAAVAGLDIQGRQREDVGLESIVLELEQGLGDLILVDRIDADECRETRPLPRRAPASAARASGRLGPFRRTDSI